MKKLNQSTTPKPLKVRSSLRAGGRTESLPFPGVEPYAFSLPFPGVEP
jgi:hypothetical protein